MEYFVIGADGQEYGPANVDTLRQWAEQSRLTPGTMLKNVATGAQTPASSIPGIFASSAVVPPPPTSTVGGAPMHGSWSQPPSAYPRPAQAPAPVADNGVFWRSILYSALSIVLVLALGSFGMIWPIYSLVYAIKSQKSGHKHGFIAIIVSAVALTLSGIAFAYRINHPRQY